MRVLVTWGSSLGGTEGVAHTIGEQLRRDGFDVVLAPASAARDFGGYDAAIVGGALYANRWQREASRFVTRNVAALRRIPVWLFSSGPLDDSADHAEIAPVMQVVVLMERIGACGHVTFGGRLTPDAKGFPAAAMAKKRSGDWRNADRIRAWAADLARQLPNAHPEIAHDPPAQSPWRLLGYATAGAVLSAAVWVGLMAIAGDGIALATHAVATPFIFTGIAIRYFGARGARDPMPTALAFTAVAAVLDAIVVVLRRQGYPPFPIAAGIVLPLILVYLATWVTGLLMSMMPAKAAHVSVKA